MEVVEEEKITRESKRSHFEDLLGLGRLNSSGSGLVSLIGFAETKPQ